MLHVILVILKIIGIVLLCILGFLILAVLTILLVPVRYDADLSFYSKANGRVRVHWLLHAISGGIILTDNKPRILVRIFGFPFIDSTRPKKEKKPRKAGKKDIDKIEKKAEKEPDVELQVPEEPRLIEEEQGKEPQDLQLLSEEETNQTEDATSEPEKESIFQQWAGKIFSIRQKVQAVWEAVKSFFVKIKFTFRSVCDKIKAGNLKKDELLELWYDQENQKSIQLVKGQIVKMLCYLKPQKLKLFLHFGLGDPAATGQILGCLACFMGVYQDALRIQPDFKQAVLEGELELKGRVRFIRFVIIGIRLFGDKNLRKLVKKL